MVKTTLMQNDPLAIQAALDRVRHYVAQVTGEAAADGEIADALGRYFVLKEIADHIEMLRSGDGD